MLNNNLKKLLQTVLAYAGIFSAAYAAENSPEQMQQWVAAELAASFPGARIEILTALHRDPMPELRSVKSVSIQPRGEAILQYELAWDSESKSSYKNQNVKFNAWIPAPIAVRRILPGEKLSPDLFKTGEVNVATGLGYEYRGVLASPTLELSGLEARNTVLEGQFLISTAYQKSPEVRRGDLVKVELSSGELSLGTAAVAQEPGFIGQNIRVLVTKTKKELVGKLRSNSVVEVNL